MAACCRSLLASGIAMLVPPLCLMAACPAAARSRLAYIYGGSDFPHPTRPLPVFSYRVAT